MSESEDAALSALLAYRDALVHYRETKAAEKRERQAATALLKMLLGREPTAEEVAKVQEW